MTHVYHITAFPDKSSYLFFYGCNWDCDFCILKKNKYDIHLESYKDKEIKFLSVNEVLNILKKNGIVEVFLGGGEPTIDPDLENLMIKMKENGIRINVLTNGELLTKNIVDLADSIAFSIKTIDDEKHMRIVHRSNKKSIENLKKLYNQKFRFETVLIKNLLDCDNVFEIVNFLKEFPGKIFIRIDPVIPINDNFVRPDDEYVDDCIKKINDGKVYAYRIMKKEKSARMLYP